MRTECSADFTSRTRSAEKLFHLTNARSEAILTSRVVAFINVDVIEIQFMTTLPLDFGRIRVQL
jgi:hypothetical protein